MSPFITKIFWFLIKNYTCRLEKQKCLVAEEKKTLDR